MLVWSLLGSTGVHAASYYTINIASSVTEPATVVLQDPQLAAQCVVYAVKSRVNGIDRYRQRVGFFASQNEAREALKKLSRQFPGAWIDQVKNEESASLNGWLAATAAASVASTTSSPAATLPAAESTVTPVLPEASPAKTEAAPAAAVNNEHMAKLMDDAKNAMVAKDYEKAIQIYKRVISAGAGPQQQEAQEYLGVARERNGQLAHAVAEYKKYLELFPQGEDAERVRQRLNGLLTASDEPMKQMEITDRKQDPAYWEFFGTLYQYYDRDTIKTNDTGSIVANSLLTTGINYNGRLINGDYKMRTSLSGIHIYDFIENETDQTRVNDAWYDMISPEQVFDARIGRQKGRSSGVVGRFDGFDTGYRFHPAHQVRLIAGYPVEFSGSSVPHETDKKFVSLGYNWTGFVPNWDANMFVLQQTALGITDRAEIGGEVRYRDGRESFFATLDYSTAFSEINYLMMVYSRPLPDQASLDVIADYRKSPFLTTSSSLQGQTVSTLGILIESLSEAELEQLALDRTGLYKSVTAIYTRPLKKDLELNADVSVSSLSGTDATAASGVITQVDAQQGTGNEFSYSAGLVSSNLLTDNDINIVNLRYSQLFNSNVLTLTGSAKYRLKNDWRIGPKLRIDQRDYDDGRSSSNLSPAIKVEYRKSRNWQFEGELTYEDKSTSSSTGTDTENNYFIHLGYFYSF